MSIKKILSRHIIVHIIHFVIKLTLSVENNRFFPGFLESYFLIIMKYMSKSGKRNEDLNNNNIAFNVS